MNITLINPPYLFPSLDEMTLPHCLGLRYISSYLKQKGNHTVTLIDAFKNGYLNRKPYANGFIVGMDIPDIINSIPERTDIIGISVIFSQLAPVAHDIIEHIKNKYPDKLLMLGGIYPSTQPALALTSKADYIVVGEGEHAFLQIANGIDPATIKGVYSQKNSTLETFVATDPIANLDDLPFPDYDIPGMEDYFKISSRGDRNSKTTIILSSRGCPFDCEFCSVHPVYGHKWRGRSAKNVLSEIQYVVKRFGINKIEFEDNNLTLNKNRAVEILQGIIKLNEEGYVLNWSAPNGLRIDTLDKELIELIARSKCKKVFLALEHGDKEMLEIMNKKLDLQKAYEIIKMVIDYKISVGLYYITGYPGETGRRFESGLNYLKKIKQLGGNVSVGRNVAKVYPGTALLIRCRKEGIINDKNFDNFLIRKNVMSQGVMITTPDFDKKEVLRRCRAIDKVFPVRHVFLRGILKKTGILPVLKRILRTKN
jgi:anaerobic magnesium-protoporphyrin IX monomethyl ester cyclase